MSVTLIPGILFSITFICAIGILFQMPHNRQFDKNLKEASEKRQKIANEIWSLYCDEIEEIARQLIIDAPNEVYYYRQKRGEYYEYLLNEIQKITLDDCAKIKTQSDVKKLLPVDFHHLVEEIFAELPE